MPWWSRASPPTGCDAAMWVEGTVALECRASEAAESGPLQSATAPAAAQRTAAAATRARFSFTEELWPRIVRRPRDPGKNLLGISGSATLGPLPADEGAGDSFFGGASGIGQPSSRQPLALGLRKCLVGVDHCAIAHRRALAGRKTRNCLKGGPKGVSAVFHAGRWHIVRAFLDYPRRSVPRVDNGLTSDESVAADSGACVG